MTDHTEGAPTPGPGSSGGTGTEPGKQPVETTTPPTTTDAHDPVKPDPGAPVKADTEPAAKPDSTAKPSADAAVKTDASMKVLFGVVFEINGQNVPVGTDDLLDIPRNGVDFTLPYKVSLGTIKDGETFLQQQYSMNTAFLHQLPGALNTVVERLEELDFTVEALHLKIPGSSTPDAHTQYTVKMSAMWLPPYTPITIVKGFDIGGLVFGLSNETPPAPDAPAAAPGNTAALPAAGGSTPTPKTPTTTTTPPGQTNQTGPGTPATTQDTAKTDAATHPA